MSSQPPLRPGPRAALSALTLCLLLLTGLFAQRADRVEALYVEGLGPLLGGLLVSVSRLVPFSLAELVEAGAALTGSVWLAWRLWRLIRRPHRLHQLATGLGTAWVAVSGTVWLFYLVWGLAYARPRIERRLGWTEPLAPQPAELIAVSEQLVLKVNDLYLQLHQGPDGFVETGHGVDPASFDLPIDEGWARAARALHLHPTAARSRGPTKPLLSSGLFSWMGIGGFYFPFTAEANINVWAPVWQQPHTRAHEMSHQRLVASENEANFHGFLACIHSHDLRVRYSGWLFAQRQLLRATLRVDYPAGVALLEQRLPGVQRDVNYARDFWAQFDGQLADVSHLVNDAYLRTNRVEGGVKSYGRSADLILRWSRDCATPFHADRCDPSLTP